MNRATVANWLVKHGPASSAALREKMGITAKGTPISSHLSSLATDKYAKKKKTPHGNVFTITAKGSNWAAGRIDEVESVETINATSYQRGTPANVKTRLPNTETEEAAIGGLVQVIEENKRLRAAVKRVHLELGALLGE